MIVSPVPPRNHDLCRVKAGLPCLLNTESGTRHLEVENLEHSRSRNPLEFDPPSEHIVGDGVPCPVGPQGKGNPCFLVCNHMKGISAVSCSVDVRIRGG